MADPGFSRGGGVNPPGGGMNTPNFPENCMKSKEFGCPGGGVRPSCPPRSANGGVCFWGCLLRGGLWSQGGAWWRPPRTATATGSMHPTGMHSCFQSVCLYYSDNSSDKDQRKNHCLMENCTANMINVVKNILRQLIVVCLLKSTTFFTFNTKLPDSKGKLLFHHATVA